MNTSVKSRFTFYVSRFTFYVLIPIFPLFLLWRALFAGEAFFWGTPLLQFVPWQRMAAQMWRSGHLPLWNPLVGCGAPLAANYQTAAFYPLNALHLLLPTIVALSWTTALHLALTGWGMYRWGRAIGLDRFPALIGALALEGSGFLVARAALFPSVVLTFPWIVVWLWRGEMLVQGSKLRDALWLGLALGLGLLAGHAQTAFYGGLLLSAYLIFRAVQMARSEEQEAGSIPFHVLRFMFHVSVALLVGVGLAAVQLLPTAELMLHSQRTSGVDYDFALTYSMWPWRLITFAAPDFFGNPGRGNYWGYATYWEDAVYVGILPLLLAIGAVVGAWGKGERRRETRERGNRGAGEQVGFWAASGLVALVLALGKNTPIFPFLFHHVPTFDLFRAPARWLAVTTVALAALAAIGAQRWPRGHAGRRRGALAVTVGGALTIAGLTAPRLVPGVKPTFGPATARLGGTLIVAGVLTLLRRPASARWGARGDSAWRAAIASFIIIDLLMFGWPLMPTVDRALYEGSTDTARILREDTSAARVYWPTDPSDRGSEHDAEYRVKFDFLTFDSFGPRDAGYWRGMRAAMLPNAGMLDDIASVNNFDPLLVGRHTDLLEAAIESPELLRVMGATHIITDQAWPAGRKITDRQLPIEENQPRTVSIYRLSQPPGRAWIVPEAHYVPSNETLSALADPAFDPAAEVLVETESLTAHTSPSSAHGSQMLTLQDHPNGVTIRANLNTPGYLVLADTWYPGWHARVDGKPKRLLRANYAFRAVHLEAGDHAIEMTYRPITVLVGGTISLAAMASLIVLLLVQRWGRSWDCR